MRINFRLFKSLERNEKSVNPYYSKKYLPTKHFPGCTLEQVFTLPGFRSAIENEANLLKFVLSIFLTYRAFGFEEGSRLRFVHNDLMPRNIMARRLENGLFHAYQLIDFTTSGECNEDGVRIENYLPTRALVKWPEITAPELIDHNPACSAERRRRIHEEGFVVLNKKCELNESTEIFALSYTLAKVRAISSTPFLENLTQQMRRVDPAARPSVANNIDQLVVAIQTVDADFDLGVFEAELTPEAPRELATRSIRLT